MASTQAKQEAQMIYEEHSNKQHVDIEKADTRAPSVAYGTFFSFDNGIKPVDFSPLRRSQRGPVERIILALLGSLAVVGVFTGFAYVGVLMFL
ncbi:hypothetical protein B0O99DRAFT_688013 [Bisporella sp. PMI_857]|nr:hypothetical protein B0O99DRAFT_688013 [Bisporella sp. PMI_857]